MGCNTSNCNTSTMETHSSDATKNVVIFHDFSQAKQDETNDQPTDTAVATSSEPASAPSTGGYTVHVNARGPHPQLPDRLWVSDELVPWSKDWPEYEPSPFTAHVVHAQNRVVRPGGWADPPEAQHDAIDWDSRMSFEGQYVFDEQSRPKNPRGRTGMSERGVLGKWGANHAADPIVTRFDPTNGQLQMVAIRRRDTGAWAIPGGMVDDGEVVSVTVRREFTEEAGNLSDPEDQKLFAELTERLFVSGQVIYRGYVDDPRNTDNAWMETTAYHFHCSDELARFLPLHAGDDAAAVTWLDVDESNENYSNLYASHKEWVNSVAQAFSSPK